MDPFTLRRVKTIKEAKLNSRSNKISPLLGRYR